MKYVWVLYGQRTEIHSPRYEIAIYSSEEKANKSMNKLEKLENKKNPLHIYWIRRVEVK